MQNSITQTAGLWAGSICTAWELVRTANFYPPLQIYRIRINVDGARQSFLQGLQVTLKQA